VWPRGRFQLRCVLSQPLTVYPGADVHGELRLVAHKRQSYDITLQLTVPSLAAGVPDHTVCNYLHKLMCLLSWPAHMLITSGTVGTGCDTGAEIYEHLWDRSQANLI